MKISDIMLIGRADNNNYGVCVVLLMLYQMWTNIYFCCGSDISQNSHVMMMTHHHQQSEVEANLWSTCYHSDITNYLKKLSSHYPNITRMISIGNSTQGRELWTMVITENPDDRPLLKPSVKFVGNVNGYSGPACVILVKLIKFLLESYGIDQELTRLIDNVEIHVLSNLNPDGYQVSVPGDCFSPQGRPNANGVDLNRNFPDVFHPEDEHEDFPPPEQETSAVMSWMERNSFVVSTSLTSGAKVVSYPYDSTPTGYPKGLPHKTSDDEIFKYLSRNYVGPVDEQNLMEWYCPHLNRIFPEGFINGAEWHSVRGSMMDYNYVHGTMELLVCVSCCRNDDSAENLELTWLNHKVGLLKMIQEAELSLRGQVLDIDTDQPLHKAEIMISFEDYRLNVDRKPMPFFTNGRGEFWRVVLSGRYVLTVFAEEYEPKVIPFEVTDSLPPPLLIIRMDKVTTKQQQRRHRGQKKQQQQMETMTGVPVPGKDSYTDDHVVADTTTEKEEIFIPEPENRHHFNEDIEEGNENRIGEGFPHDFEIFHNRPFNFSTAHDNFLAFHELQIPHRSPNSVGQTVAHSSSSSSVHLQKKVQKSLLLVSILAYYYYCCYFCIIA